MEMENHSSTVTFSFFTNEDSLSGAHQTPRKIVGDFYGKEYLPYSVMAMLLGAIGVVDNAWVLVVLCYSKKLKTRAYYPLLMNQTVTDFLASASLILNYTVRMFDVRFYSLTDADVYCRLFEAETFSKPPLYASTFNLIVFTVERYLRVVFPIFYRNSMTRKVILILALGTWAFAPAFFVPYVASNTTVIGKPVCTAMNNLGGGPDFRMFMSILQFLMFGLAPAVIIIYSYSHMLYVLNQNRLHHASIAAENGSKATNTSKSLSKAQINVTKTFAFVAACFVICWTPSQVAFVLFKVGVPIPNFNMIANRTMVLVFINTIMNPFIYAAKYPEFQTAARSLFCRVKVAPASLHAEASTMQTLQPGSNDRTVTQHVIKKTSGIQSITVFAV